MICPLTGRLCRNNHGQEGADCTLDRTCVEELEDTDEVKHEPKELQQ